MAETAKTGKQWEAWLLANIKYIVAVLAVGVVSWGSYALYGFYRQSVEKKAQDALFAIEFDLEKKEQELLEAQEVADPKSKDKKTPPMPKEIEKTPESLAANFGSHIQRFENFIQEHRGTKASYLAAISLADIYLEYKEPKKAVAVLRDLARESGRSDLFFGLLNSQLGLALSNAGECEEAVAVFDSFLKAKSQRAFHSQALLRKGACEVVLQRYADAQTTFERVQSEFPESYTGEMAKGYERLVQMKKAGADL